MAAPKPDRAAELYQAASEAGRIEALYNLAGMTRVGAPGVEKDQSLAFCMYEVRPAVCVCATDP